MWSMVRVRVRVYRCHMQNEASSAVQGLLEQGQSKNQEEIVKEASKLVTTTITDHIHMMSTIT